MYVIAPCYCPRCRMDHTDIADSVGDQVFSSRRGYRFVVECDACYFSHTKPTTGQWQRYLDGKKTRMKRLPSCTFDPATGHCVIEPVTVNLPPDVEPTVAAALVDPTPADLAGATQQKTGVEEMEPVPSPRRPRGAVKKGGKRESS